MKNILSPELIRFFIDNTPVAYIVLDNNFRIHYINKFFLKLRNLDMDTTLGEYCYNISNGGKMCNCCAVNQAIQSGEKTMISRKDILQDGSVRFVDDYAIPLYTADDGTQYILEIMANRTQEMLAYEQRDRDYNEILSILSSLLEAKDQYTASHSHSVHKIAVNLAKAMNLDNNEIFDISVAANLHDIGKVRVPHAIINKPGGLTDEEYAVIKNHPITSFEMLQGLSSFTKIKETVKHHHERYDGRGYPDGLKGDEISIGAKIIAVADTYDAITSTRSYRKALSHEYALEEIKRVAGTQLDPEVVKVFLKMNFSDEVDTDSLKDSDSSVVQRELYQQDVQTESKQSEEFNPNIDEERMLTEIFNHTPCGYVLMDINREVLFASNYFLEYMGLEEDEVIGRKCYEAGGIGTAPCENCVVVPALKNNKMERVRQEQVIKNSLKIFDMYAMPLFFKGKVEYVIEIIIDRTKEVLLSRERKNDFNRLIEMLRNIYDEQSKEFDSQTLSQEIIKLRGRLKEMISKQALTGSL